MRKTILILIVALIALSACNRVMRKDICIMGGYERSIESAKREKEKRRKKMDRMVEGPIGIDVSHHQGFIDWPRVVRDRPDIQFVYVKITEGATYVDSRAANNFSEASSVGFPVGGYHFFRMTSGAQEQYEQFTKFLDRSMHVGMHVYRHYLIPMVDVETADGHPVQELQDSLQVMLDLLEEHYGKKPVIYGTMRSYNTLLAPDFNDYPLYIGRYGVNEPEIIDGDYTIWQFSEKGHIDGIPKCVDFCRFHRKKGIKDITLWQKNEYLSR